MSGSVRTDVAAPQSLTVMFLMAGRSERAGYKYAPFLDIGDKTMIEAAVQPFVKWLPVIKRLYFVYLEEQEVEFSVAERLSSMFADITFDVIQLKQPTRGPAETLASAVDTRSLSGPTIVCDCDQAVDIEPLMSQILSGDKADCIFPTWDLRGEDLKAWSVAAVRTDGSVTGIAEKRLPSGAGEFVGVVGCYYFANAATAAEAVRANDEMYISGAINSLLERNGLVKAVRIEQAEFFGDKERLRRARTKRNLWCGSIFCDIDGTVVQHEDQPNYDRPLKLLPGSVERLREWVEQGYLVVLMTARASSEEDALRHALTESGLPFHRLISGLPSGPRYIVNDRKPSAILVPQVHAYEVERNRGIGHVHIPRVSPAVLKRFTGGSFAETLLIEDEEKRSVRKRVSKRENLSYGYAKLRSQYHSMERFSRFASDLVPALYGETDNSFEYYYDMEYLPHHKPLSQCTDDEKARALTSLMALLESAVYSKISNLDGPGSSEDWLLGHVSKKIYPKLDALQSHPKLAKLVSGGVVIEGSSFPCLRELMSRALEPRWMSWLAPQKLCAVHGDLTFENVLVSQNDVRVIDMDGSDYYDAPELDMGKLFQSLIGRYEEWAHTDVSLLAVSEEDHLHFRAPIRVPGSDILKLCLDYWTRILGCSEEQAYSKGLFYMGLHFIRMVPFRQRVSEEQALYAMANAVLWISRSLGVV